MTKTCQILAVLLVMPARAHDWRSQAVCSARTTSFYDIA